ncbi:MAG: hypothetical protein ACXACR_01225 [Candidatus Hodarchaeales archaeon]|jgi:hypothetical protein
MISVKFTFFASLQNTFGEEQKINVNEPIRLIQLFNALEKSNGKNNDSLLIEKDILSGDSKIILNSRNIHAFE